MTVELFNLKDDLSETHNLAMTMPEKAAELRVLLHNWRQSVGAQMPTPNPNYRPGSPGQVRTRSTASPVTSLRILKEKMGTRWNASLPSAQQKARVRASAVVAQCAVLARSL
jgi:hypothetical protein